MTARTRLPLDDEDDDLEVQRRVEELAKQQGVPSLSPTSVAPIARSVGQTHSFRADLPAHIFDALAIEAARRRVTKRYLLLEALRQAGFPVRDDDLAEDGRRIRGRRKG